VTRFLHDVPDHRSRAEPGFYEALELEFRRDMDIVRDDERRATSAERPATGRL
jgi:hypothetical protein